MAEGGLPDDDISLPRTAVNKLIKEMLPNMRISNDARELVLNCCTEFIHLLAAEANEECTRQSKKTIGPEHILVALKGLGFDRYVPEVEDVLEDYKVQATQNKKKGTKLEDLGIPEEELLRQQEELFAQARMQQMQMDQEEQARAMAAAAAAGGVAAGPGVGAASSADVGAGLTATQQQLAKFQAIAAGTLAPGAAAATGGLIPLHPPDGQ